MDAAELVRANLHRVFGERDAAARRAAIDELFADDARWIDHDGTRTGPEEIAAGVDALLARSPADLDFAETTPVYLADDRAAVAWALGPVDAPVVRGLDLVTVRDGRITELRVLLAQD